MKEYDSDALVIYGMSLGVFAVRFFACSRELFVCVTIQFTKMENLRKKQIADQALDRQEF